MTRQDFKQYMLCGHGRCFSAEELENFRDIVLYGCLNDITYDLQCEGSRGLFMYNLALQYEDYNYFLQPAIEKFLSPELCDDWHLINHLCDFIDCFAGDYGDKSAQKAVVEKYRQLYKLLMSLRWSAHANEVLQCYEYIAIVLIQNSSIDTSMKIFGDMGNFFIRRRRADDRELKWNFAWFWSNAQEKYGKKYLKEKLEVLSKNNAGLKRFRRVMMCEENSRPVSRKPLSAEDFIEIAEKESIQRKDVIALRRAEISEKIKIADAVVSENDLNKKAELLKAFTVSANTFPLEPEILVNYADSENENLRETAVEAMDNLKADCIHDFAVKRLEKDFSVQIMRILLNNYRDIDKKFISDRLDTLKIDRDNESGWHNIVLGIVNNIEELPDEFIYFVYEKSMCSCCRESAVDELIRRNLFTEEIKSECLMDCNYDIRREAENYARKS